MTPDDASGKTLATTEILQWEPVLQAFEKAWQSGKPPRIEDFLGPIRGDRLTLLVELVHTDLEFRRKAGDKATVEEYLRRFPELKANPSALVLPSDPTDIQTLSASDPAGTPLSASSESLDLTDVEAPPSGSASAEDQMVYQTRLQGTPPSNLTAGEELPWWVELAAVKAEPPTFVPDPLLPKIPGYEVLALLGRGGMGVVYKARQVKLKRLVALKMTKSGPDPSPLELRLFRREAEAVAQLQHPNIVQIFEVGQHQGQPFFSLELVEGGSLSQQLNHTPQPPKEAARLVETLARAMHMAHQRAIVHRDLKPSNVLLSVDGVPKISDFGLAKRLDRDPGITSQHGLIGTPSYMAPEQARGETRQLGPLVDVYALGAILYEMLTGRPPFRGSSGAATLELVRHLEVVPPSRFQAGVPRDLETICLKCLEKDQQKRYATAEALADDLRRFLNREPVLARPTPFWARLAKWARRHPAAAALVGVIVLAAIAIQALIGDFAVRESKQHEELQQDLRRNGIKKTKAEQKVRDWISQTVRKARDHIHDKNWIAARIELEKAQAVLDIQTDLAADNLRAEVSQLLAEVRKKT